MTAPGETPKWLRRYASFTAAATLFLIFAGAMVTSTGSGLAVPDWPLSYGMLFPPMVGGIFYEHGHRMVAATVGLLTLIQAVWLQKREPKAFVRRLGWLAVAAVVVQGILGGMTVRFFLPPAISVSHAALAEIFLSMNIAIAFFTSRLFLDLRSSRRADAEVRTYGRVLVVAVFVQIVLGAIMRHLQAGLAIPDFPLSFGRLVPPLDSTGVIVNFLHRVGAAAVAIVILAGAALVRRQRNRVLLVMHTILVALLLLQVILGAFTVWSGKQPHITSLHVVTGASILATAVLFALAAHALTSPGNAAPETLYVREAQA